MNMKRFNLHKLILIFTCCVILSCSSETSELYPRKYVFNSISISNTQHFIVQGNQKLIALPNRFSGSYSKFTNEYVINDALMFQNEIEGIQSFTMKSKQEIEIELLADDELTHNTINVDNEAINGVILPLSKTNINLNYNSEQDELVICMENLRIFTSTTNGNPKHSEYFCSEESLELSAQDLVTQGIVVESDTIGLYRLNFIYKRQ